MQGGTRRSEGASHLVKLSLPVYLIYHPIHLPITFTCSSNFPANLMHHLNFPFGNVAELYLLIYPLTTYEFD